MRCDTILTALDGPATGMCWELVGNHVLGRDGDIAVDDAALSRTHLRLRVRHGALRCSDPGSANGSVRRPKPHLPGRRIGPRWTRLRRGTVLELGAGRYRVGPRPGPLRETRWGLERLVRLLVPTALAAAMIPFAASGPAWRWLMVLAPLAAVATMPRAQSEVRRCSHPAHVLIASREGRAFHAQPVLPRELRALRRRPLGGTGWAFIGERAQLHAIWLAGFLAVHNDPDVVRVTSPWLTTRGNGLEVTFEGDPLTGPGTEGALVTWRPDRAPQWALRLRPPSWAAGGAAWISAVARATTATGLPQHLSMSPLDPEDVLRRWDAGRTDLDVPLGRTVAGTFRVDLARHGPHALVAGMSGAGKSELLTTWLLELARRNSPSLLRFVLVDFKGGAAFNALERLPHCVGVLTDLDPQGTARALTSLRAQLRDRERRLAAAGARDVRTFNERAHSPVPLMVVVIDEFRALAEDHPELMDQFLRLANQGRSLGLHLVAATQRPGGAISPELRTNMPLRICLRVPEAPDSLDVLGVADAAHLEPVPGRAVARTDSLSRLQVAWSGSGEAVAEEVNHLRALWGGPPAEPPWCAQLPTAIGLSDLGPGALALSDEPDQLRQSVVTLPDEGLLVLGTAASGRTTTARAAVAAALGQGDRVWLVSATAWDPGAEAFGGTLHPAQTRLVGGLLAHLVSPEQLRRTLVFDDIELWSDAHDALHGAGVASSVLATLVRTARAVRVRVVAVTLPEAAHARWATPLTNRLHLSGLDPAATLATGVGRQVAQHLRGPRVPGRGVLTPGDLVVQVGLPARAPEGATARVPQFRPLPPTAEVHAAPGAVVLGCTGSGAVAIEASGSVVVVGPVGSGRTTAARLIAAQRPDATLHDGGEIGDGDVVVTTTPAAWIGTYSGPLSRLRDSPVLLLRPDLCPRIPGPDYRGELEPGTPGYAVLLHRGRATALRVATSLCR